MKNDLKFIKDKIAGSGVKAPSDMDESYVMYALSDVKPKVVDIKSQKKRPRRLLAGGIAAALMLTNGAGVAAGMFFLNKSMPEMLELPGGHSLVHFRTDDEIEKSVKEIIKSHSGYDDYSMWYSLDMQYGNYDDLDDSYNAGNSGSSSDASTSSGSSSSASTSSGSNSGSDSVAGTYDSETFSETYKQVDGVDEADIIKTDGRYIYCVNSYRSESIAVFTADNGSSEKIAEITVGGRTSTADETSVYYSINARRNATPDETGVYYPTGMSDIEDFYIHGDRLIAIVSDLIANDGRSESITRALVYDISDIENIVLLDGFIQSGYSVSTRMIGDMLYIVSDFSPYDGGYIPACGRGATCNQMSADCVYGVEDPETEDFLIVSAYNTADFSAQTETKAILGAAENLYCSGDNIYIYSTSWNSEYYTVWDSDLGFSVEKKDYESSDVTSRILKVNLTDGISFTAYSEIDGEIYGQYAFDESGGYLRVATTSNNGWQIKNNLFVLDESLSIVGSVSGFAENEEIKAVRYFGDTAYVITFKQTDPLFVIDLSDPANPEITGSVEISGFSTMLVPIDADTVLGIGNIANEYGAVYGTKLALFDVSDKSDPKVLDSRSYTNYYSDVQNNPKALVYNPERNDYVIPLSYVFHWYYNEDDAYYIRETGSYGGMLNFRVEDGKIVETELYKADCKSVDRCVYVGDYVYMSYYDGNDINICSTEYK